MRIEHLTAGNLPLESTAGAYSEVLNGPIFCCQRTFPVETSSANTRAFIGTVINRRPLFPAVTVKTLSSQLKSWIHINWGLRAETEYNSPSVFAICSNQDKKEGTERMHISLFDIHIQLRFRELVVFMLSPHAFRQSDYSVTLGRKFIE